MVQFKAFETCVEVKGAAVLAIIKGLEYSREIAESMLEKNGIPSVSADAWYPQQSFLDAFKTISESLGPHTLYSIGTMIHKSADFPENIQTLEEALRSVNVAYQMNHRGGDIGYYRLYISEAGDYRMVCRNPYPCEFDRGIIEGIASTYSPPGTRISAIHDDNAGCRDNGDESCAYTFRFFK